MKKCTGAAADEEEGPVADVGAAGRRSYDAEVSMQGGGVPRGGPEKMRWPGRGAGGERRAKVGRSGRRE